MLENIQQDVHDARVLIEESGTPENVKKYRRAAEIILLKVLRAQPQHEEAKALLQCVGAAEGRPKVEPEPEPASIANPRPIPAPVVAAPVKAKDDVPFRVATPVLHQKESKKSPLKALLLPLVVIGLLIAGGGLRRFEQSRSSEPVPAYAAATGPQTPHVAPIEVPAPEPEPIPADVIPEASVRVETPPVNVTTPREIKPSQPVAAAAPAQITVQINAKPWAQVFIDGSVKRPLGQTPLSGVTVPVGRVLVFENPDFATKSHRITERDSAIQVEFP